MAQDYETIQYDVRGAVCAITLNRPDVYNAFNEAMTIELLAALRAAGKDDAVRAVVITGAGKAFCSGQDLKELKELYVDGFVPVLGERLRKGYNPIITRCARWKNPSSPRSTAWPPERGAAWRWRRTSESWRRARR